MTPGTSAGVDVGGGGIRIVIRSVTDSLAITDDAPAPRSAGAIDVLALGERIARLLSGAPRAWPAVDRLAIGLTGMPGLLEDPPRVARALAGRIGVGRVTVASDVLTTHLGALAGQPGVVTAAGTGAISFGTDFDRVWNRSDGWGHLLGDVGSGAWIGARGLVAALREHDRAGTGSTRLLRAAAELYGGPDRLLPSVYGSAQPAVELARFALTVSEAAAAGDEESIDIWRRAGVELAGSAVRAAVGVPPLFSWGGGPFRAGQLVQAPFRHELARLRPDAQVVEPRGSSVDGALLLAGYDDATLATWDHRYVISTSWA